ncbi:phosphatase PAP2 family protein [Novosphingobium sp. EMRT-2]|uniref:acid phosphatase n=1 Tax=Novosphingobium sp. EMRT-2 TaxID=2571749 RepID=UPI0010BD33A8|nr:phosphatase PAP2 family protein [Novosphingobium sp. EMRT-2]QCI96095.1 phosphatase PAP2 family protein [Novosphingobium sp. EMRT-2]
MTNRGTITLIALLLTGAGAGAALAGQTSPGSSSATPLPLAMTAPGAGGYLAPGAGIDSVALVPPAPAAGSATEARDHAAADRALALQGKARFTLAASDADLWSPKATGTFSCTAGLAITPTDTPALNRLMRRAMIDFGMATSGAKDKYKRPRPFMENGKPTCTPSQEAGLRNNGSYPSGHSAIGYGWGLLLAELIPDRATQLVARGRTFGESRRICNVHWESDIEEGRVVASAVFARMQLEPDFQADLAAARAELASQPHKAPDRDCAAEAAALAEDSAG